VKGEKMDIEEFEKEFVSIVKECGHVSITTEDGHLYITDSFDYGEGYIILPGYFGKKDDVIFLDDIVEIGTPSRELLALIGANGE
jgi:hypothetical protein